MQLFSLKLLFILLSLLTLTLSAPSPQYYIDPNPTAPPRGTYGAYFDASTQIHGLPGGTFRRVTLLLNTCFDMPTIFNRTVQAVTVGNLVTCYFYDIENCKGERLMLWGHIPNLDYVQVGWRNRIASFWCKRDCSRLPC